jgi:serine/threonine-protein kinase
VAEDVIAGRYRLLEPLGRGAMSAVWLAEDEELARRVALKTLAPSADRARFDREARAAASLAHPNICALYDYGEADGRPYMVLEYLPNGSLEERLAAGRPLDDTDTHRIATELAAGLAHAHARGLVHRDLKPANVLFDAEGRAKIADFGIARMTGTGTLTEAGTVLGTASYISPEQAAGEPAGPASDVYSFGAILFRMLTGRLPFVSSNAMELVRMHRDEQPPPVAAFRPDAPPRLAALAEASLAKDPVARPPDGQALFDALRGDETGTIVVAPAGGAAAATAAATQVLRPAARRRRIVPALAVAVALLLVAAGVAVAVVASHDGSSSTPPSVPSSRPLRLRSVSALTTTRAEPTTTASVSSTTASTTAATSTARTTTHAATTTTAPAPTTTHRVTTQPATTALLPTTTALPTTAVFPTTTAATTTAPTTTAPTG